VPTERDRNFDGYLEMMNSLLRLAIGLVYHAERKMGLAGVKFFTFLWEEIGNEGCDFFCDIKLFVLIQQPSEFGRIICLLPVSPSRLQISNASFACSTPSSGRSISILALASTANASAI